MNNFFIDFSTRSFTDIDEVVRELIENGEKARLQKFQAEIEKRKNDWKELSVGSFGLQCDLYEEFVKMDITNHDSKSVKSAASAKSQRQNTLKSQQSIHSKGTVKKQGSKEKKTTESTDKNSTDHASDEKALSKKNSGGSGGNKSVKSLSKKGTEVNSN